MLSPSTQYTLQVQVAGVASGTIFINGSEVVHPSDFDMNATLIEKPVQLQASNVLSGEIRGKPEGYITVQIIGVDNDPPTISAEAAGVTGKGRPRSRNAGWNLPKRCCGLYTYG